MDKKKLIKWIIAGLLIGIIFPARITMKDGGSVLYKATTYQVMKLHRINTWSESGYDEGTIVKVLGIEVVNTAKKNDISNDKIEKLRDEIITKIYRLEYDNYGFSNINEYTRELIIGLKDNSEESQEEFKKNISDSPYITLVEAKETSINVLYMYVQEETISNIGATIIIKEIGDEKHNIDSVYQIEVNKNNEWEPLQYLNEPNWEEISFRINEEGKFEQKLEWEKIYGKLPKGLYRVVKKFQVVDTNETGNLYAEFNI